jgi:glutathione S-transferase
VLKLIASRTSPYARKVRVVLAEKKVECQVVETSPYEAGNPVHAWNPLGKLPVLILDDGTHLFDSRVIVEYIDLVSPVSRLIPEPARQRIAVKKWEALADGVNDATATIVLERKRPANLQSDEWIARQRRKVDEGVAEFARELGDRAWCFCE